MRLMRPYALFYFYRRRLRVHWVQELLAAVGIAVAVALVLAAMIAEGSIAGSTRNVVHAFVGPASLQLRARGDEGFPESMLARVESIPGVKQAGPILERTATVSTARGRHVTIDIAGTEISLAVLDGLAHTLPVGALTSGGIGLSRTAAERLQINSLGASPTRVTVALRGSASSLNVSAVLGREAAGALSGALVGVMPLRQMQRLCGLPGRLTRIFIQTQPGQEARVRTALERLAGATLTVAPAEEDVTLLRQALAPSDQASAFFAAVSAVIGLLFAFTAMLLTVPERRRAIADLRLIGTRRSAIVQMVLFQALCLGALASLLGVGLGYLLSVGALHQSTGYLAEAFTLGSSTVVGVQPVLLAFAGGVLATCLACAVPLLDLRRGHTPDGVYHEGGVPGNALSSATQIWLGVTAVALIVLRALVVAAWPSVALAASALLAVATVLAVPLVFAWVLRGARWLAGRFEALTVLPVALAALRGTTLRSLVLAATGAVAIFGSIALGGARQDLLRGIGTFARSYSADAPLWVTSPDDNQAALDFAPGAAASRIARMPGVAGVQAFQGGFAEMAGRRVWIIARPPGANRQVLATQLEQGSRDSVVATLGRGGEVAISKQLARALHVGVGGTVTLPTPTGNVPFAVAATTTNLAWSPGAIFISTRDYSRYWNTTAPTALAVSLTSGASPTLTARAVRATLGPASGLEVATAAARQARIDALTGEGLNRLGEIATLLVLAAVLAMAAALGSSIWQRRASLAGLRLTGVKPRRLRRILMTESLVILTVACLTGGLAGVYGEQVIDDYLRAVTGFPVAPVAFSARPILILAVVLACSLAITAAPGWFASRVSPTLALEGE
jgi:putative ABC transport system permease protein